MSKINDLIKKLCPNGVEYKTLDKVCNINKGKQLNKDGLLSDGMYPVINGGITPSGYWNDYNYDENLITISQGGASAGYIAYQLTKFWAGAHCYVVEDCKDNIVYKYLYHFLKSKQADLQSSQVGAGIPSVSLKEIYGLKIPLPPLEVQEEIVRILDKFGELEAELEAEIEARKSQYEFWRGKLLNNDKYDVVKINEIANSVSSGKCSSKSEYGAYPVYGSTGIIARTDEYLYDDNKLLIARVGANAGFVQVATGKYNVTDNALILNLKDGVDLKFMYYNLQNYNLNKLAKGGGQPLITGGQIKDLDIVLPPLDEQKRIANVLDKFDALVNDITDGIPAEIELRRQQYEYYRNKLLNFEELEVS